MRVSSALDRARRALDRPLRQSPRRALSARHRRHLFAARRHRARARSGRRRRAGRWPRRPPTRQPPSLRPTSTSSPPRSRRTAARSWRAGRLRSLRRAVDCFGFHLAPLDLRQNSDVHERTVAELFAGGDAGARLSHARRGRAHRAAAAGIALAAPARLAVPRLWRRDARASSPCSGPPPRSTRSMARRRSAPASSPRRRASPTCWSSRCC